MNNLKRTREERNISVGEMAKKLGIESKEYLKFEKEPLLIPVSVACKISNILNCTIENIFLSIYLQNEDVGRC